MGRQKTINKKDKTPYFFARKGKKWTTYYYTRCRPAINLGKNRAEALKKWAELEAGKSPRPNTISAVAKKYFKIIVPDKAIATQKINDREWKKLEPVFGNCNFDGVEPHHIQNYISGRTGKVRANREIALLSHIWNYARNHGHTKQPNPCIGVKRNTERGRDRYIEDHEYTAVYEKSDHILQDFMDMMLFGGQRNTVSLNAMISDIKPVIHPLTGNEVTALHFPSVKRGKKVRVIIEGDFEVAINRMLNRERNASSLYLIADENGQNVSYWSILHKFKCARKEAGVYFQLRDIRPKTATDETDFEKAHERLGHTTRGMSEHYIKDRQGVIVMPGRGIKK